MSTDLEIQFLCALEDGDHATAEELGREMDRRNDAAVAAFRRREDQRGRK